MDSLAALFGRPTMRAPYPTIFPVSTRLESLDPFFLSGRLFSTYRQCDGVCGVRSCAGDAAAAAIERQQHVSPHRGPSLRSSLLTGHHLRRIDLPRGGRIVREDCRGAAIRGGRLRGRLPHGRCQRAVTAVAAATGLPAGRPPRVPGHQAVLAVRAEPLLLQWHGRSGCGQSARQRLQLHVAHRNRGAGDDERQRRRDPILPRYGLFHKCMYVNMYV